MVMTHDEEKLEPDGQHSPVSSARGSSDEDSVGSHHDDDEKPRRSSEHRAQGAGDEGAEGEGTGVGATRSRSRASSSRSRALVVIPRSERRGLFGHFAILPEVGRPYDYENKTKWTITAVVAVSAAAAPVGSAIFYPALPDMAIDLNTSPTIINLTVALYMLAMAIFPLWWSFFSETLGRRSIYLVSFALFILFSILSAASTNVAMLIVMRLLGGGASASVQAVGAGTIADIWEPKERGRAMGMFYLGPLSGPMLAPIIGGTLSQRWGWRSNMWFLAIFGALAFLMIVFCLPETLARPKPEAPDVQGGNDAGDDSSSPLSQMLTAQSVQHHTKKAAAFLKRAFIDPLRVLAYLRFPPIAITVYYAAITFGSLFVLNISQQSAYSAAPYHFSELVIGLLYLPGSLGYLVASLLGGRWIDRIMAREARTAGRYDTRGRLVYLPEDRMRENAWLAATTYPAALVVYGWTVQRGVTWVAPAVANFFFGVGSMLVFGAATTMLTEFMPRRSSSGIALNNFVRNIFSCTGTVVTQPLINAIGHGWMCSAFGLASFVSGYLCIWALRRYGPGWRRDMDRRLDGGASG